MCRKISFCTNSLYVGQCGFQQQLGFSIYIAIISSVAKWTRYNIGRWGKNGSILQIYVHLHCGQLHLTIIIIISASGECLRPDYLSPASNAGWMEILLCIRLRYESQSTRLNRYDNDGHSVHEIMDFYVLIQRE